MKDVFDKLMEFLAAHMGAQKPEKIDGLFYMFEFGTQAVCFKLLPQAGNVLLFADLGVLPEHNRVGFYERLLNANHALFETAGATLSVSRELNMVALQYLTPVGILDGQRFMQIVENFLTVAARWHEECNIYVSTVDETADPDSAEVPGQNLLLRV